MKNELKIFISHRHDDNDFAKVFKNTLRSWGFLHVFEASDPENGITAGASIVDSIKTQIKDCHLLIHIFTRSDANWEWVSKEIGIAESQSNRTRIVTFQIFDDEPRIRQDALRVRIVEKEIESFVRNIFCEDQFFPSSPAVWPSPKKEGPEKQAHENYIKKAALKLYQALQETAAKAATKQETKALKPVEKEDLKVFISCRDCDMSIGEAVKKRIESWGLNVGMSTAEWMGEQKTLEPGFNKFLWECHLVILIFTRAAANWSQCNFEIGTANEETIPTRMAKFQILAEHPNIAFNRMPGETVDTRVREEMNQFVTELFYKPDFFPGFRAMLSDESMSDIEKRGWESYVQEQGNALFEDLEQHQVHASEEQGTEPSEIETRWGYFSLSLSADTYNKCDNFKKNNEEEKIFETLKTSLRVVNAEKWGLNHFGYNNPDEAINVPEGLSLNQLFETWEAAVGDKEPNTEWTDELVREVWAFRTGKGGFDLSWKPFLSAHPQIPGKYPFYPVVTLVEKFQDNSRIYQICTFGMPYPCLEVLSDYTESKMNPLESTEPISDLESNQQ